MPISIIITSPTPFCPIVEPCEKLTAVHASTMIDLIQNGGALSEGGFLKICFFFMVFHNNRMNSNVQRNRITEI